MSTHNVPVFYLAGPIAGCTYEEAIDWREDFINTYHEVCEVRSPMRGKGFLSRYDTMPDDSEALEKLGESLSPLARAVASKHAIMVRDYWDVISSDCVIINLLNTKKRTIGTLFELAWCYEHRIPAIVIMEEDSDFQHPFVQEAAWVIVSSIDEAKDALELLLGLFQEER